MSDKSTTKKRKSQREAAKKRQQQIYILVGIVIVAIIAVIGIVVVNRQNIVARQAAVTAAEGGIYQGIERTVSEEGLPQLGSSDAPVTVHEYSSFTCGHCANFHDSQFMELLDDVQNGDIRLIFVPVTGQSSLPASAAAFCAAEQDKFWEMHDILFNNLKQFGGSAYQIERLRTAADALGLDVDEFETCLTSEAPFEWIGTAMDVFQALAEAHPNSVTGTPTITFNGQPTEYGSGGLPIEFIDQQIAALLEEG